jgi:MFS family permease
VLVGVSTILLSLTFHIIFLVCVFGIVAALASSGSSISNTAALLARWFHRKRATVLGINATGLSLGGLIMVPFAMYLLQATNWRVAWAALGLTVLLAVPLALKFVRQSPAERGLRPDGDPEPQKYGTAQANQRRRGPLEVDRWAESLRSFPFWQMSGSYLVCGATTFVLSVHFVPYAIDRGVSPGLAATIFGLMSGLNVIGSVGAGMLSDRFNRKNLLALVYFVRGVGYLALIGPPIVGIPVLSGDLGLWLFAFVAGFSWVATAPLTSTLTADVYGLRTLGTVSGVTLVFHQIGGFGSVLLAGLLYDITGSYTIPFLLAGSLLFPAALCSFSIKERKYSARYQPVEAPAAAAGD